MVRWLAAMVLLQSLAGCTDDTDGDVPEDIGENANLDDVGVDGAIMGPADWREIGLGVAYREENSGPGILIAYGGYTAKQSYVAAWATELVDQKLGAADVGHVYIVRGPQDPSYAAREIANSKLRLHLLSLASDAPIYIVAHSSGAFVAHELLGQLLAHGDDDVLGRIAYADLDGGGSGLSTAIAQRLGALSFVYARDPGAGLSQNAGAIRSLGSAYGVTPFEVTVAGTGCSPGAGWCLHDVVITHRPHNPATYDLQHDYTDFVGRPVTAEYLTPLIP